MLQSIKSEKKQLTLSILHLFLYCFLSHHRFLDKFLLSSHHEKNYTDYRRTTVR